MKIKYCKGIKKYFGLMFSKPKICLFELNNKKYVWHSFFVYYPLVILFLNKKAKIIEIAKLKPFGLYKQKKNAFYAIEIPEKFINKNIISRVIRKI